MNDLVHQSPGIFRESRTRAAGLLVIFVLPVGAAIFLALTGRMMRFTWLTWVLFGGLTWFAAREVRTLIRPLELRFFRDTLEVARGDRVKASIPWEWIRNVEYVAGRFRGFLPYDLLTITYLDLEASVHGQVRVRELRFGHTFGTDPHRLVGILRARSPHLT